MTRYLSKVWVVCAPVLVACSGSEEREPISAASLALTAEQNVENALRGAHAASSFIADSATLAKLLSAGSQTCEPSAGCAAGSTCVDTEPTCTDSITVADLAEARADAEEAINDLVKTLKEEIFIPANLESEDGQSAVYRLTPEYLCKDESVEVSTPGTPSTPPMLDAECVERATELQPRLRLTSPSDGDVDVALLLTAQKKNPATLQLRSNGVGVQIDLAELKGTLDAAHQDTGNLASMSGKLQFELKKNAELDYSFRFNVLSTLSVNTIDALMQQVAVTLAGNTPSFELRLDGNAHKLTGTYHFGAFGLKGPLNALYTPDTEASDDPLAEPPPAKTYTGIIDLLVAGYDGSLTFDGNRDRIELRALGLGDKSSTLKHDGNLLAQLDINPNDGRHFDLAVERNSEDQTTLTFSPTFDFNLLLNFASLKSQIADIPDYALNDTLRIFFNGSNPSVRTEADQVRVLSGTLNLTSKSTPGANLSVPTGSCLLESDATDPAHEVLGKFVSGTCL
ncbi:MAG: hypothetical protein ACOY0T_18700 [Myxococcota bacterium]